MLALSFRPVTHTCMVRPSVARDFVGTLLAGRDAEVAQMLALTRIAADIMIGQPSQWCSTAVRDRKVI
jgi:hypothetical protein